MKKRKKRLRLRRIYWLGWHASRGQRDEGLNTGPSRWPGDGIKCGSLTQKRQRLRVRNGADLKCV